MIRILIFLCLIILVAGSITVLSNINTISTILMFGQEIRPVSYTHLTLPTIYSV